MKEKYTKKSRGTRFVLLTVAIALVLCSIIGVTVAWLMDKTDPVVNTFTYGDIKITLAETDDGDGNALSNSYLMMPGSAITKDPKVTVIANSEAAYLYVKIVEANNFDTFMTYAVAEGWTALDGEDGVYYREVSKAGSNQEFGVIKDNVVNVKNDLDSDDFATIGDNKPTLTITAYAIQKDNTGTAAQAWVEINK